MGGTLLRIASAALVLLNLSACVSALPRERPTDLSIRMIRSGGQQAEGSLVQEELFLSADSESHYTLEYQGGGLISFHLDVKADDLDDIYLVLRDNSFAQISTHRRKVKGRGGTDLTVEWEDESHTVYNSGTSFVDAEWKDEWKLILMALIGYRKQQIEKQQIEIPEQFELPKLEEENE